MVVSLLYGRNTLKLVLPMVVMAAQEGTYIFKPFEAKLPCTSWRDGTSCEQGEARMAKAKRAEEKEEMMS
jgi:hypothetical protein